MGVDALAPTRRSDGRPGRPDGVRANGAKRVGFHGPPARRTPARHAHRRPPDTPCAAERAAERVSSRVTVATLIALPPSCHRAWRCRARRRGGATRPAEPRPDGIEGMELVGPPGLVAPQRWRMPQGLRGRVSALLHATAIVQPSRQPNVHLPHTSPEEPFAGTTNPTTRPASHPTSASAASATSSRSPRRPRRHNRCRRRHLSPRPDLRSSTRPFRNSDRPVDDRWGSRQPRRRGARHTRAAPSPPRPPWTVPLPRADRPYAA